jgi:hypothetical protein
VTAKGLKAVVFSVICGALARAAGKGVTARRLTVDSSKLKEEKADPSPYSG